MQVKYSPSHVANYFLDQADKEGLVVTPMKLLKLVYIGYGWVLALTDKELFDEPIEAWAHGPVIPSLYHEFKRFGRGQIKGNSTTFDLDSFEVVTPYIPESDSDAKRILAKVWAVYKNFSAIGLRNKTHESGTPWSSVYKANMTNVYIPEETIKSHFTKKISEYVNA